MYHGWFEFGGSEIANAARTYAYAKELAPGFTLLDCTDCDSLAMALGDGEYRLPYLDEPSWFDANNPHTYNFAGFYPLEVAGVENSNREVEIYQSIRDGGIIGPVRRTTKDVVVRGILVAGDPCALQVGIDWLNNLLRGNPCADDCQGDDLCFFNCCPDVVEGTTAPNGTPVATPLSLSRADWIVTSGDWSNGHWDGMTADTTATGPLFEPPCDNVIVVARFQQQEDQTVSLTAVDNNGIGVVTTGDVVLRMTNLVRNPMFRNNDLEWTAAPSSTIDKVPNQDAGIWVAGTNFVDGTDLLIARGGYYIPAGKTYSGRITVKLLPPANAPTNLIENPRFTGTYFWHQDNDPSLWSVGLDTTRFQTAPTSLRFRAVTSSSTGALGSVTIGSDGTNDRLINVDQNQNYVFSTKIYSEIATSVQVWIRYFNAAGAQISNTSQTFSLTADSWNTITRNSTSPAGAESANVFLNFVSPGVSVSTGDSAWVDSAIFALNTIPIPYFDGDSPDAVWNGTPNQSTSSLVGNVDDVCIGFDVATLAGGTNSVEGPNQTISVGVTTELTFSGLTVTDPGALVGVLRACGPIPTGTRIEVTQAIITETEQPVPYFDGNSEIDGYEVVWNGPPDRASSSMVLNELRLTVPNGTGPFRPELSTLLENELVVTNITVWAREEVDPAVCAADNYQRTLRNVVVSSGPEILRKVEECDHAIAEVEFTFTAGNPYVWHMLPFDIDVTGETNPDPDIPPELVPQPNAVRLPAVNISATDNCPTDPLTIPLSDPNCPLPPAPPKPPLPEDCVETVTTYRRRGVTFPGGLFTQWQEAVPIIEVRVTSSTAVRQARVRFFPNPLNRTTWGDIDACDYCGEFIISYLPGNSVLTIDGVEERATVMISGRLQPRSATHLLYGTDGGPMTWPILTCGTPYVVAIDVAPTNAQIVQSSVQLAVRS